MEAARIDRRLIPVLLAGCVIATLCVWRVSANRPAGYNAAVQSPQVWRPAPRFETLDANNQMFRLERYLGRHRVLVIFVPGRRDEVESAIRLLQQHLDGLERQDVKIAVLSPALPQQHREWMKGLGAGAVPVLTDLRSEIAARWGVNSLVDTATFLVDRKGDAAWSGDVPRPEGELAVVLKRLTSEKVQQ
ncbi:MAG TPA: redoxin domain-containing protein [Planctomycetaceae bacterium]|nr:redoxin domain-containing protein [Planctomycetaceae bacterium]